MTQKRIWEMTDEQVEKAKRLTQKEQKAVDAVIAAAKALPSGICIDADAHEGCLFVTKRYAQGCAVGVAKLKKRNLIF